MSRSNADACCRPDRLLCRLIIVIGMRQSNPQPSLIKLISPLA